MKNIITIVSIIAMVICAGTSFAKPEKTGDGKIQANVSAAMLLPPAWVSASYGVYADRIVVSWAPWVSATDTNYYRVQVYRSIGPDPETAE